MGKIVWKKEWILDCSVIDEQHKALIDIVNKIIEKDILVQPLLEELIKYAAVHFNDEEQLMMENKYPIRDIEDHKAEHRQFTSMLLDISFRMIDSEDSNKELSTLMFVLERYCILWFQSHFLNTDKKFTTFLRRNSKNRRW